jgi:hypothetical protein
MARARSWLVEHHYLLVRERDIRRLVIAARRHHEQALFKLITAALPTDRESWVPRLLAPIEDGGLSRCEWLGAVPSNKVPKALPSSLRRSASSRNWAPTGWPCRICRSPVWSISRDG